MTASIFVGRQISMEIKALDEIMPICRLGDCKSAFKKLYCECVNLL